MFLANNDCATCTQAEADVALLAQHSRDDVVLIGFDQHLPTGQKPLLPDR